MQLNPILNGAKFVFSITLLSIFSTIVFAQSNETIFHNKINFYSDFENISSNVKTRPRIYGEITKTPSENTNPTDENSKIVTKPISTLELEKQAFEMLNRKRVENGLQPVVWNEEIAKIARFHSQNMANNNFFSHQGLDGLMVDKRADSFGVKNWRSIGENIAYNRGYDNPVEFAVLRWMQSQGHRENLLNNKWKESGVGIAIAPDGKTYYFTQVFMLRK